MQRMYLNALVARVLKQESKIPDYCASREIVQQTIVAFLEQENLMERFWEEYSRIYGNDFIGSLFAEPQDFVITFLNLMKIPVPRTDVVKEETVPQQSELFPLQSAHKLQ